MAKEIEDEAIANKFGDHLPNNLTASFTEKLAPRVQLNDKSFCLQDLETSQLRNDLDESNIEEDHEDIQRSHLHEIQPAFDDRDPNDKSLSLTQLEHSQFTYSKNTSSKKETMLKPLDLNQISRLSQFEQTEIISHMQTEIQSYKKIIAKQEETIRLEQSKLTNLEDALSKSQLKGSESMQQQLIIEKMQALIAQKNPDMEELIKLSIQQERLEQQRLQGKKDKQVLEILKHKDTELYEMSQNYQNALQEIDILTKYQEESTNRDSIENELRERIEILTQENNKLMDETIENQKHFQAIAEQLNQDIDFKDRQLVDLMDKQRKLIAELKEYQHASEVSSTQENSQIQVLNKRLKMLEEERGRNEQRQLGVVEQYKQQIEILKQKLN